MDIREEEVEVIRAYGAEAPKEPTLSLYPHAVWAQRQHNTIVKTNTFFIYVARVYYSTF